MTFFSSSLGMWLVVGFGRVGGLVLLGGLGGLGGFGGFGRLLGLGDVGRLLGLRVLAVLGVPRWGGVGVGGGVGLGGHHVRDGRHEGHGAFGHGQRLDDAGEVAELAGDVVAALGQPL